MFCATLVMCKTFWSFWNERYKILVQLIYKLCVLYVEECRVPATHIFLTHGCREATSLSLCGYLSVGQLNNGKWPACFALVMGDTEYSVFDTSDTINSGIGIDYWRGIVRYLHSFLNDLFNFTSGWIRLNEPLK